MQRMTVRFIFLGAGLLVAAGLAQTTSQVFGHWQGKIQIPGRELGISVDLARSPKGTWIGSMSVVGSTAVDVPLSGVVIDDTAVRFTADLPVHASFDGRVSGDTNTISGTASSVEGQAPFQLTRNGEAHVKMPPPSTALSKEFEGAWEGTLDAGAKILRIGLKLSETADGTATATLISVDQGNQEIPVTTVTINGTDLQLEARAVSGNYRGILGARGDIAGEWSQGPSRLPLTFKRASSEKKP